MPASDSGCFHGRPAVRERVSFRFILIFSRFLRSMSSDDDFESSGLEGGSDEDLSMSASGSLAESGTGWGNDDDFDDMGASLGRSTNRDDKGYEILTAAEVMKRPIEMITEVNELFQIDPGVARQLLQHSNWNKEKLVTRYFAGEKDKLFQEAKIPLHLGEQKRPAGLIDCSVCFDEFESEEIFGMSCNHFFCRECYSDYLMVKINSEGQAADIPCPAQDCFLQVDEVTAMKLLPDGATKGRYLKLLARAFVRDNKSLRGCPAPGCGNFARVALVSQATVVECSCGEAFCSGCEAASHRPCSCEMMEKWNAKIQSDSESENWLKLYTRACPKCKAMISKDGGCQYIRCRTCNTGFCWLCMQLFDHKNHDCNKLELGADASDAAKSLAKWEHFSKRYASHAQAITIQSKLIGKAKDCIATLENEHHKAYIELVYILEATHTILAARKVLRDTYVYGFFLPDDVNRALFEHLQGQLETKTEQLSGLVEQKPVDVFRDRLKVIDIDKALRGSLANVLEGLETGDVRGGQGAKPTDDADWAKDVKAPEYDGWIYNA